MQQPKASRDSQKIIADYQRLLADAAKLQVKPPVSQSYDRRRDTVVICAPHPDDECLMGAVALMLRRKNGWQIINMPMTYGSDSTQVKRRRRELKRACAVAGFVLSPAEQSGFTEVNLATRQRNKKKWRSMVLKLVERLKDIQPKALVCPHAEDGHPTHIGTHWLVMDALAHMPKSFKCDVYLTEYWQPMADPNLLLEVPPADAALLLEALSCHVGENKRNNFAARFPAWLMDNVRRGAERAYSRGCKAPQATFAVCLKKTVFE